MAVRFGTPPPRLLRGRLAARPVGPAALLLLVLCLSGCATVKNSFTVGDYAGRTLSTRRGEGSERLQSEVHVDVTIKDYVTANGRPDYIHVVDRMSLYFFYVRADRAVKFERDLIPPSVARVLGRIPGSLLKLLPERDVTGLLARRKVAKRRTAAQDASRRRTAPRRPPPASADTANMMLSRFDVPAIIERMRTPLSAADPGVSGWRSVKFSDGIHGRQAQLGNARWEVRSDRIVVALPIGSAHTRPPGQARIEVMRANSAVFGAHAKAVTAHAMTLMQAVAADRSGRRPAAERIRGRLVRIQRVPRQGLLVYGIHP